MRLALDFLCDEEGTEGTCELRHNSALDTRHDERAVRRHHRNIREEDILRLFRSHRLIEKGDGRLERSLVGAHVLTCLLFGSLRVAYLEAFETKFEFLTGIIRNR